MVLSFTTTGGLLTYSITVSTATVVYCTGGPGSIDASDLPGPGLTEASAMIELLNCYLTTVVWWLNYNEPNTDNQ